MVILQKWEPGISASFPSMIHFWIELKGLPKHYWIEEMLFTLGGELGEILDHEITLTTARIKIFTNGLKPLTMEAVVEFLDGSKALVTLDYKGLRNH